MPIQPFLNGVQFDQETVRILGLAFEQVCIALRIGDCGDDLKNAIAPRLFLLPVSVRPSRNWSVRARTPRMREPT